MKRIEVTVPLMLEMAAYQNLDAYLVRPLSREHLATLSADARAARQRAFVRVSKLKAKMRKALSAIATTGQHIIII